MGGKHGFLYGAVALQAALIDTRHFNECMRTTKEWDENRDGSIGEMLVKKGWIRPSDRAHLEYLVERRLQAHSGNAEASLASLNDEIERTQATLGDATARKLWHLFASEEIRLHRRGASVRFPRAKIATR